MLHAGLDLSRNRIDVCLLSEHGELVEEFVVPSDHDGIRALARRVLDRGELVRGVIESMTGARFVHDSQIAGTKSRSESTARTRASILSGATASSQVRCTPLGCESSGLAAGVGGQPATHVRHD